MLNDISLESKRLFFKRVSEEHVSIDYLTWLNDTVINMYLEVKVKYSKIMLEKYIQEQNNKKSYFWAIHLKDSNKHIGNIKIDPINIEKNSGEYGILIGDKLSWGKGFAKEASIQIIEYCFSELKLTKITLGVIEDNIIAIALYKKIGFSVDEVRKDFSIYNNKLSNLLRMSLHVKNFK